MPPTPTSGGRKKIKKPVITAWNESGQYAEYSEQEWASWKQSYSKGKKQWDPNSSGYSSWTGAGDDSSSVSSSTWPSTAPAPVVAQAKAKKKETRDQIMRQGREARAGGRATPAVEEMAEVGTGAARNEPQPVPAVPPESPPPPPATEEALPVVEHRLDRQAKASVDVEGSAMAFIPQPQHGGVETEKLNAYTGSKQHDSFTSGNALTPLFSISRAEEHLTATVSLPVVCGYRATFTSKPFELSQELDAKAHAGKECLKALTDADQLDTNYDPVSGIIDHDSQLAWPVTCRDQITMDQLKFTDLLNTDTWPEVVVLIRVEPNPKPDGWMGLGFIIAPGSPDVHLNFALQVEPDEGQSVWLEPSRLPREDIEFFGGDPLAVQKFHNIYKAAAGLDDADSKCVVRLVGGSIDWEQMSYVVENKALDEEVPSWLKPLWQRVDSLNRLQQLSNFAPVAPVPNPLRLEAVLGGGYGSGHQAFSTLELIGRNVLKLLFSIAMYIDRPFDDAKQLSHRISSVRSPERLGEMFKASQLDCNILESEDWCPRKSGINLEKAASMLEALVGAYVSEIGGDFYSIVKLWKWLCESAGRDESIQSCQADLTKAVQFLSCAAPAYKGRTPTYEYFSQVDKDGVLELEVKYEDRGKISYRRPGTSEHPYGVEVCPGEEGGPIERPVRYDTARAAWQSPTIVDRDEKGCCRSAVLPNKVKQFLRGQCPAALTTWKPYKGETPPYDALRELRDGSLHVLYRKEGWFQYQRCPDGGLGFEKNLGGKDEPKNPVVYTERGKTLLSPYFNLESLPNKVTEWLLRWKCLAQLVTPKSSQNEDVNIQEHDDWIEWTTNAGQRRMCRCEQVQCAIIFVAGAKEEELEELLFDGETWATVNDRAPLPNNAVKWLTRRASDKGNSSIYRAYAEQRKKTVWLPPPLQLVSCFPRLHDTDIGQLQTSLSHDFTNPMLLAEALTHASVGHGNPHDKTPTPDCQRLACVGSAVAEELVTRLLVEAAKFSTAATIQLGCYTPSATFAVGRAEKCDVPYQRPVYKEDDKDASPRIPVCANAKDLRDRWSACCSHVAYATSCVQMQLHKGIQHNSPELSRSIKSFTGTVNKAWKKDANPWPRILAHDAPRAIGDAFIACLGAMVLDGGSGYLQAREVLIKHVQWCEKISMPEVDNPEQCGPEDITPSDLLGFVKEARGTVCEIAFAPPAPPLRPDEGEGDVMPTGDGAQQVRNALALTDLYACKMNGVLVGARSPRTAPLCVRHAGLFQDGDSDSDVEDPPAETAKSTNQSGRMQEGDAVYCEICEMWLNGPTQYEDHRVGKHKKNCKRQEQRAPCVPRTAPCVPKTQAARASQPWPNDMRGDQETQYPSNHPGPGYDFHGRNWAQHAPPPLPPPQTPPPQHYSGYEHHHQHPYPYHGGITPPPMMASGYAPWPQQGGSMLGQVIPQEYWAGDAQSQRLPYVPNQ